MQLNLPATAPPDTTGLDGRVRALVRYRPKGSDGQVTWGLRMRDVAMEAGVARDGGRSAGCELLNRGDAPASRHRKQDVCSTGPTSPSISGASQRDLRADRLPSPYRRQRGPTLPRTRSWVYSSFPRSNP